MQRIKYAIASGSNILLQFTQWCRTTEMNSIGKCIVSVKGLEAVLILNLQTIHTYNDDCLVATYASA